MIFRTAPLVAGFAALLPAFAASRQDAPSPRAAAAVEERATVAEGEVSAERLRRIVRILASDAFEGREMGTEGSRAAARYAAAELEALGVAPLGDEGTYLQALTMHRRSFAAEPELSVRDEAGTWHALAPGADFTLQATGLPEPSGELALVSASSEAEARERARGDAALALLATPGQARRWLDGAELGERMPPVVLVPGGERPGRPARLGPFDAPSSEPLAAGGHARVTLHGAWSERLEANALAAVRLVPHVEAIVVRDANVVGWLRGVGTSERPELADETIVVSAHRDHIGVQRVGQAGATEEDRIANGADDDASGCAVLLELARCMAAGAPPARSIVFLLVTGEEKGMLGSAHYVAHPLRPLERTVANLNLEMLGMVDPLAGGRGRPWLTGFERSDLGPSLAAAGIDVQKDPRPRLNLFARSDNVSFARAGIVAHTLSTGGENPNYHQVRDEWHTLDYEHMAACAEVGLAALRHLADGSLTPRWLPGEPSFGR